MGIGYLTSIFALILMALLLFVIAIILGIVAIRRDRLPLWQRIVVIAGPFLVPILALALAKLSS